MTRPGNQRCKNPDCTTDTQNAGVEASGYCFACAEELAVLLAGEGCDPRIAWYGKPAETRENR